jgi:broad specificity phosphatase PhoE
VYDHSGRNPRIWKEAHEANQSKKETAKFAAAVGRALRRAAKTARKTARAHGTPIYIWKDGKVVAEKPR